MRKIDTIWLPETQQRVFRGLMDVMSHPGKTADISTLTDNASPALAILATLLDGETTLCDHHQLLDDANWPLLQAEKSNAEQANFILCLGEKPVDFVPRLGELASPEHSATIVLFIESITAGNINLTISGPGVNGENTVQMTGLNQDWLEQREQWINSFPLGVDLLIVDRSHVMAIPRTSKIEVTSWDM